MSRQPLDQPKRRWARAYPPLLPLLAALAIAVLLLPSALNLPQSNPTTVLEYAPVPPDDENPPPPAGNLSSLGLSTSGTLNKKAPPLPPLPPLDEGIGGRPLEKHCVGDPPRQTEDPASPPCVPYFDGDNFGAPYQGVEKQEIRVLVYFDSGGYGYAGRTEQAPAAGTYVDVDKPRLPNCAPGQVPTDPDECDHVRVRVLKGLSKYFNQRFQTYDRHVHYYAYFTAADSAAERRSDAVANWEKLKPFAVIDAAGFFGFNEEYQAAMARLGVMTFSSTIAGLTNEFYRANAPLSWGFWPDVERWVPMYATYICQKVAPYPVRRYGSASGTGPPNGEKREFGIYYPTDPAVPSLTQFAQALLVKLRECGVRPIEATYSAEGYAIDGRDTGTEAAEAAALFQSEQVTTVMYVGTETRFSNSLDAIRYYPEVIVAGNLANDNNFIGQTQNQNAWKNAWAVTYHIREGRDEESPGFRAYKEGDPTGSQDTNDAAAAFANDDYRDHFMLFQGIQVAGPRLTPESIDQGFHAIPERESTSPFVAAFYFAEGDYTSTKDAAEQWWDPTGRPPGSNSQRGCWRMANEGLRSLPGHWRGKDDVFRNPGDPCTGYGGSINLRA